MDINRLIIQPHHNVQWLVLHNKYKLNNINIKKILCGSVYSLILFENGDIYFFGTDTNDDIKKPFILLNDPNIYDIYTNGTSSYIINYNGTVKDIFNDKIIMKDMNLKYMINSHVDLNWIPSKHNTYPKYFDRNIRVLYLIIRYFKYKISKYVIYIIIRFFI